MYQHKQIYFTIRKTNKIRSQFLADDHSLDKKRKN